jgi:hypothetical protein
MMITDDVNDDGNGSGDDDAQIDLKLSYCLLIYDVIIYIIYIVFMTFSQRILPIYTVHWVPLTQNYVHK